MAVLDERKYREFPELPLARIDRKIPIVYPKIFYFSEAKNRGGDFNVSYDPQPKYTTLR